MKKKIFSTLFFYFLVMNFAYSSHELKPSKLYGSCKIVFWDSIIEDILKYNFYLIEKFNVSTNLKINDMVNCSNLDGYNWNQTQGGMLFIKVDEDAERQYEPFASLERGCGGQCIIWRRFGDYKKGKDCWETIIVDRPIIQENIIDKSETISVMNYLPGELEYFYRWKIDNPSLKVYYNPETERFTKHLTTSFLNSCY